MKCHPRFAWTLVIVFVGHTSWTLADSDGDSESLPLEHRGPQPEPFLDKLAALFGGGSSQDTPPRPQPVFNRKQLNPQTPPQHPPPQHQPQPGPLQQQPPFKFNPFKLPPVQARPQPPKQQQQPPHTQQQLQQQQQRPPRTPTPNFPPHPVAEPSNTIPTFINPASSPFGTGFDSLGGVGGIGGGGVLGSGDPWQIAQPANMAQIKDLQVQCEKDLMRVRIIFDRPFYGMVFSKGHYSNINCVHVPSGLGQTQATFDIALQTCGMTSSLNTNYGSPGGVTPQGSFIENTIVIQYDPLLQEVWDQARKLRCTWYDYYEKAVTFKPYQVDMLDPVTANFLGDNLRCWMQIQVGKGPYASEVSGIVKIGQTMTMVLGVKDDENKFDMMVRNCVAHDGQRAPIQLVDQKGCVIRPKIMSPFKKIKNFDSTANVLAYAYFQAFKFPDSMNVHFQCVVQVCRGICPEPQCGGGVLLPGDILPNPDGYGAPQAPALDSYGSPIGNPFGGGGIINPRLPTGGISRLDTEASEDSPTIVHPDGQEEEEDEEGVSSRLNNGFNKRMGSGESSMSLGGKPRSLDSGDAAARKNILDVKNVMQDNMKNSVDSAEGEDVVVGSSRSRRDANGNVVLRIFKRDATEMAEVETTEKVIQVLAPNDVQFSLSAEDKQEVVINTNGDSLCVDTAAFVGLTVAFLMILIVALITILFLWLRIKNFNKKQLL